MILFRSYQNQLAAVLIFIAAAVCSGCASPSPARFDNPAVVLTQDHKDKSLMWWEKPGFKWEDYHQVMMDPVTFQWEADTRHPDLTPEEESQLIQHLNQAFKTELGSDCPLVVTPGHGVLRIRAVITRIETANPLINAVTTLAAFIPLDMGGAAIKAEFYDANSGDLMAAMADHKTGTPLQFRAGFSRLGHAMEAFTQWAKELKLAFKENA